MLNTLHRLGKIKKNRPTDGHRVGWSTERRIDQLMVFNRIRLNSLNALKLERFSQLADSSMRPVDSVLHASNGSVTASLDLFLC